MGCQRLGRTCPTTSCRLSRHTSSRSEETDLSRVCRVQVQGRENRTKPQTQGALECGKLPGACGLVEGRRLYGGTFREGNAEAPRDDGNREGLRVIRDRRRRTLPPGRPGSTIRATGLNFRVRNGIGWIPRARVTDRSCGIPEDPWKIVSRVVY